MGFASVEWSNIVEKDALKMKITYEEKNYQPIWRQSGMTTDKNSYDGTKKVLKYKEVI